MSVLTQWIHGLDSLEPKGRIRTPLQLKRRSLGTRQPAWNCDFASIKEDNDAKSHYCSACRGRDVGGDRSAGGRALAWWWLAWRVGRSGSWLRTCGRRFGLRSRCGCFALLLRPRLLPRTIRVLQAQALCVLRSAILSTILSTVWILVTAGPGFSRAFLSAARSGWNNCPV
jgi:hypothetical protein